MTLWRAALSLLQRPKARADAYDLPLVSDAGNDRPLAARPKHTLVFRPFSRLLTPRRALCSVLILLALLVLSVFSSSVPPDFEGIRELERRLPQHDLSLPPPEGVHGRYVFFADQWTGLGFNNILQESLMLSHLAHLSNRAYVFHDYTWSTSPSPFVPDGLSLRPSRVPLNAFISGPTAGGPIDAPRAVSRRFWEDVCPVGRREAFGERPMEGMGDAERMGWWVDKLKAHEAGCLVVSFDGRRPFGFDFFSTSRFLTLYPALQTSPVLISFKWSALVLSVLSSNAHLFPPPYPSGVLPGVVAVHLRRGDYAEHCAYLAERGLGYMGMNQHPSLPDRFVPPSSSSSPTDKRKAYESYAPHCLPTLPQLLARLHTLRSSRPELKRVYVMTNAPRAFYSDLKRALLEEGWESVLSGRELEMVDPDAGYVGMAVDMAVAQSAEVFLGNGFSSLSANVVMLRLAEGREAENVRFL